MKVLYINLCSCHLRKNYLRRNCWFKEYEHFKSFWSIMPNCFPERLYQFMFLPEVNEHCSFNFLWGGVGINSITFLQCSGGILLPHLCVTLMTSWRVFMIRKVPNQVLLTQKSKKLFWFSHRLAKGGKNEKQIIRLDTEVNLKMGLLFHWVLFQVSSVLLTNLPFHWTKFTWESIKADCAFSETRAGPIMLASSDLALSTVSAAHQKSSLR